MHETPRLMKKPGGQYLRVENQDELEAAEKDGWFVTLPKPTGIVLTDAPPTWAETAQEPAEIPEAEPDDDDSGESSDGDEPATSNDAPRRRGRPRKHA